MQPAIFRELMKTKTKTKPCPFCGSSDIEPQFHWDTDDQNYVHWVECLSCDSRGPKIETDYEEPAIEKWNKARR